MELTEKRRGDLYAEYLVAELNEEIIKSEHSQNSVAMSIGLSNAAFSRCLNLQTKVKMIVIMDACEVIGVDPCDVIEAAYKKLCDKYGKPTKLPRATRMGRPRMKKE